MLEYWKEKRRNAGMMGSKKWRHAGSAGGKRLRVLMPNAKIQMSNKCQKPKSKSTITRSFLSFDIFNLFFSLTHYSSTPSLHYSILLGRMIWLKS